MSKTTFMDKTYSLAKGLHFINNAKLYFEDVRINTSKETKHLFNAYVQKCDWILNDVRTRLSSESKSYLDKELEDSLIFDAITDKLVRLDKETRDLVESYIDEIIKKIAENESK